MAMIDYNLYSPLLGVGGTNMYVQQQAALISTAYFPSNNVNWYDNQLSGGGLKLMGGQPLIDGTSHLGQVKETRKALKKISKEDFRKISKTPIVKDILSGATKLTKEELANRIKEHVEQL